LFVYYEVFSLFTQTASRNTFPVLALPNTRTYRPDMRRALSSHRFSRR
jgi:hypothetical protein